MLVVLFEIMVQVCFSGIMLLVVSLKVVCDKVG